MRFYVSALVSQNKPSLNLERFRAASTLRHNLDVASRPGFFQRNQGFSFAA
jgi:hypothetical protein